MFFWFTSNNYLAIIHWIYNHWGFTCLGGCIGAIGIPIGGGIIMGGGGPIGGPIGGGPILLGWEFIGMNGFEWSFYEFFIE